MRRLLLPICLGFVILSMGGFGIYREATIHLSHALNRFQAALPPDAHFSYDRVRPAIFIGGVTLYNVNFRYRDTVFHAYKLRFGYPKTLSNGDLSLSRLRLDEPQYNNRLYHISAKRIAVHRLLIPSSSETLHEGHVNADSMHSLAAILSFKPQTAETLRFAQMQLTSFNLTTHEEKRRKHHPIDIHQISANNITLEGYGLGNRIHMAVSHLNFTFQLNNKNNNPVLARFIKDALNQPDLKNTSPFTIALAIQHFEAKKNSFQWLKRPFRHEGNPVESFWKSPSQTLWEKPGKLEIIGLSADLSQQQKSRHITLAHLFSDRSREENTLHTTTDIQGLSFLTEDNMNKPHFPQNFHIISTAEKETNTWQDDVQIHTSFSPQSALKITMELNLPDINPLHLTGRDTATFLQKGQILHTSLTTDGTDLFAYYGFIDHNTQPHTDMASNPVTDRLKKLTEIRPITTPVEDYLSNPEHRTLNIITGPISLTELAQTAPTISDEALFDQLHITNITAKEQ